MAPVFFKRYGGGKKGGGAIDLSKVYGMIIDNNEPDPSKKITYIGKNADFHPITVTPTTWTGSYTITETYGSYDMKEWGDTVLSRITPCMLNRDGTVQFYMDKDDRTKKEDGSASGVMETGTLNVFEGSVMVEIPKIYWTLMDNGDGTGTFCMSEDKVHEDLECWSHIDANDDEIDKCYLSAFKCTYSDNRYRSLYGYSTKSAGIFQSSAVSIELQRCRNNNVGDDNIWFPELQCDRALLDLILMMLAKTTDIQNVYGFGYMYTTSAGVKNKVYKNAGYGFSDGHLFSFRHHESTTAAGQRTDEGHVRVFGIDDYWGNGSERIWGLATKGDRIVRVKMTYGQRDGSTISGFENTVSGGAGFVELPDVVLPNKYGLITEFYFTRYGLFPKTVLSSGSHTEHYCDYYNYASATANNGSLDFKTPGDLVASGDDVYRRGPLWRNVCQDAPVSCRLSCKPYASRVNGR